MSSLMSPALLPTTTYVAGGGFAPAGVLPAFHAASGAGLTPAAVSAAQATSAANYTANAATLSQRAATLDAFTKGLGALAGIVSVGMSAAAALKKKPADPLQRQRELERRLIAQRAGQREGGIASTRKTGPLGDPTQAPTGKRTLLGG